MVKYMKKEIYLLLEKELTKFLFWLKSDDRREEDFDIDEKLSIIFEVYNVDIQFGFLYPIYCFYDVVSDAVRHEKKEISKSYFMNDAIKDLEYIIKHINENTIDELEKNEILRKRLTSLYEE
jgi:hypothetical protein